MNNYSLPRCIIYLRCSLLSHLCLINIHKKIRGVPRGVVRGAAQLQWWQHQDIIQEWFLQ